MLLEYHRASLLATQAFWRLLLHEKVDLVQLTKAFRRIDDMERKADRTYRMVLRRCVAHLFLFSSVLSLLDQAITPLEGKKLASWVRFPGHTAWCCGGVAHLFLFSLL
jgi:hypothetical protein